MGRFLHLRDWVAVSAGVLLPVLLLGALLDQYVNPTERLLHLVAAAAACVVGSTALFLGYFQALLQHRKAIASLSHQLSDERRRKVTTAFSLIRNPPPAPVIVEYEPEPPPKGPFLKPVMPSPPEPLDAGGMTAEQRDLQQDTRPLRRPPEHWIPSKPEVNQFAVTRPLPKLPPEPPPLPTIPIPRPEEPEETQPATPVALRRRRAARPPRDDL